jgi:hypothetical protein
MRTFFIMVELNSYNIIQNFAYYVINATFAVAKIVGIYSLND